MEVGNCDAPEDAFFIENCFKILIVQSLDVEEGERTSDIEENNSHNEVFPWTGPVRKKYNG